MRSATAPGRDLLVLGVERQAPDELAGLLAGAVDLGGKVVVVGDQRRVGRAERDQDRAGQGREVDDPLGAELDRVGEGVGEDQAALGVGVVDLDRLAVVLGDDVAGLDRGPGRHVLGRGDHGDHVDRQLELGDRGDRLRAPRRAPDMSIFISCIPAEGLSEIPPVSKVTPLPTRPRVGARAAALVAQHDQLRLLGGALADGDEAAHLLRDRSPRGRAPRRDRRVGGGDLARRGRPR